MKGILFCSWDFKDQPEWDTINQCLREVPNPSIVEVETGSDTYVVAIAPVGTSVEQATEAYHKTIRSFLRRANKKQKA